MMCIQNSILAVTAHYSKHSFWWCHSDPYPEFILWVAPCIAGLYRLWMPMQQVYLQCWSIISINILHYKCCNKVTLHLFTAVEASCKLVLSGFAKPEYSLYYWPGEVMSFRPQAFIMQHFCYCNQIFIPYRYRVLEAVGHCRCNLYNLYNWSLSVVHAKNKFVQWAVNSLRNLWFIQIYQKEFQDVCNTYIPEIYCHLSRKVLSN